MDAENKYSLSNGDTAPEKYGDYYVYGEDITLQPSDANPPKKKKRVPKVEPFEANRCEKCNQKILDGDRLCIHCYNEKVIKTFLVLLLAWIATAVITDMIFGASFTFGSIFWFLLMPNKKRYINKRKLYNSIPVTPEELVREVRRNPEYAEKCKSEYDVDDVHKLRTDFLVSRIQEHKSFKKLKRCKSNVLVYYPQYLSFVRDTATTSTNLKDSKEDPSKNTITQDDVNSPQQHEALQNKEPDFKENLSTPVLEDKPEHKPQHNYKTPLIAVIIALVIVSIASVATIIYQQTIIQEQRTSYSELDETCDKISKNYSNLKNNFNELEGKYNSIIDEYEFYQYYAVCVVKNDPYYHSYNCERFKGSFWIYNIEAAKSQGYEPCPVCR